MDFLVKETSISLNLVNLMLKYEETKAVCFHEVCLSGLNEKVDFLKLRKHEDPASSVLMSQNAAQCHQKF